MAGHDETRLSPARVRGRAGRGSFPHISSPNQPLFQSPSVARMKRRAMRVGQCKLHSLSSRRALRAGCHGPALGCAPCTLRCRSRHSTGVSEPVATSSDIVVLPVAAVSAGGISGAPVSSLVKLNVFGCGDDGATIGRSLPPPAARALGRWRQRALPWFCTVRPVLRQVFITRSCLVHGVGGSVGATRGGPDRRWRCSKIRIGLASHRAVKSCSTLSDLANTRVGGRFQAKWLEKRRPY